MASDQIIHNTKQYKRSNVSLQIYLSMVEWMLQDYVLLALKKIKLVFYCNDIRHNIMNFKFFDYTQ